MSKITIEISLDDIKATKALANMLTELYGGAPPPQVITTEETAKEQFGEGSEIHLATKALLEPPPPPPDGDEWPQMKNGIEVDVNGIPWDARIHSSSRKCTKEGRWAYKRGGDKAQIPIVEAQLKKVISPTIEAALPPPPPPPQIEDFPSFMQWIVRQDPIFTNTDGLNKLCEKFGMPSIALLASNPGKIPSLVQYVSGGGR